MITMRQKIRRSGGHTKASRVNIDRSRSRLPIALLTAILACGDYAPSIGESAVLTKSFNCFDSTAILTQLRSEKNNNAIFFSDMRLENHMIYQAEAGTKVRVINVRGVYSEIRLENVNRVWVQRFNEKGGYEPYSGAGCWVPTKLDVFVLPEN